MTREKSYHIYLEDKVLFKNLERELFEIIWDKLYVSYHRNDLTYTEVDGEHVDNITAVSYTHLTLPTIYSV